jgi:nitrogen PTS system EIIA component
MKTQDFLNLGQVAAFLGWTPRFVERLAQGGKIPGLEINGQWRFRREELVDWLDQKIQTLDATRLEELELSLGAEVNAAGTGVVDRVSDLLDVETVEWDSAADRKSAVLKELVEVSARTGNVLDTGHLHASLVEREALCSTAFPGGVAICHPRRPASFALRAPVLALVRTREAVSFGAPDDELTQVFFLHCALDERSHLHGLARLARILNSATLEELRHVSTARQAVALLKAREEFIHPVRFDSAGNPG